jgi:hypothetical protein
VPLGHHVACSLGDPGPQWDARHMEKLGPTGAVVLAPPNPQLHLLRAELSPFPWLWFQRDRGQGTEEKRLEMTL